MTRTLIWHRPRADPKKRGPFLDQKRTPQKMSPNSWGTRFGGSKVDLKSGPCFVVKKGFLHVEILGKLYVHVTTKQVSRV